MRDLHCPRTAASVLDLLAVAEVPDAVALAGTDLARRSLEDPHAEVAVRDELRVIENVLAARPDRSDLGLEAGGRCRLRSFGLVGLLWLSCDTSGEALERSVRYQDLCHPLPQAELDRVDDRVVVSFSTASFAARLRPHLVDHQLAVLSAICHEVTGRPLHPRRLELRQPRPPHEDRYEALFGVRPRFDADEDRLVLDAAPFDAPMPQGNVAAMEQLEADCRAMLARRSAGVGMTGLVRRRLDRPHGPVPSLEEVAGELHLAPRSVRRHLAKEGTSFRALDVEARRTRAVGMLREPGASVDGVASALGYATSSAFVHAFRRWTGNTPGAYRRATATPGANDGTDATSAQGLSGIR